MKLSQGDSVVIIAGKDKGKKGRIMRVLSGSNRVIVSGINMMTKHVKRTAQAEGKIVKLETSISVSNVQIVDPKTGKPSRIGYKIDPKSGKKVRIAKKSGTVLGRTKIETKSAEKSAAPAADLKKQTQKKGGFWKKVGFGADASSEAGKGEAGPATAAVHRSTGRGS
ncbi:50S ribosomal protein L24 [Candidatus Peribacteria bacterium]|nr:50S ribosomal protein L24 [Candidatus Peribacteria bacterium]